MGIKLKICNKGPHKNPNFAKKFDSGMDVYAWVKEDEKEIFMSDKTIVLESLERRLVHTGIYVEIPEGYEVQVRPKSGRALKEGLSVLNTPGTVDNGYRGEICIICVNLSKSPIYIKDGEKIAQIVVTPVVHEGLLDIEIVDEISEDTDRGEGGFGSTKL